MKKKARPVTFVELTFQHTRSPYESLPAVGIIFPILLTRNMFRGVK